MRETLFTACINISTLPQVLSTEFENKGNDVLRLQGTTSSLFRLGCPVYIDYSALAGKAPSCPKKVIISLHIITISSLQSYC